MINWKTKATILTEHFQNTIEKSYWETKSIYPLTQKYTTSRPLGSNCIKKYVFSRNNNTIVNFIEKKLIGPEGCKSFIIWPCNFQREDWLIDFWCLTPLSAIFQLYHGDQVWWWKKPEYPERTTDHGQAIGKLYHLRLRVEFEYTLFCNLQSRARTHSVLVIGLYELLYPTT